MNDRTNHRIVVLREPVVKARKAYSCLQESDEIYWLAGCYQMRPTANG
jgi:hypothetical protein